jgi:hypothetical protein
MWSIDGHSAYGWRVFSDGNGATDFGYVVTAVPTPLAINTNLTRPGLGWLIGENLFNPSGFYEYYYAVTETPVSSDDFVLSAFYYIDDVVIEQKFVNLGPVITQTATPTVTPTVTLTPGSGYVTSEHEMLQTLTITSTDGIGILTWEPKYRTWTDFTVYPTKIQLPADARVWFTKGINTVYVYITDNNGNPIDCSSTPAELEFLLMLNTGLR